MASTCDWKSLTNQNVYDIMISLNFPKELASQIKNKMPNGLLAFVESQNINTLKSENAYLLNSILTLLKYVNADTQHLYPIQFKPQINEEFDYLIFQPSDHVSLLKELGWSQEHIIDYSNDQSQAIKQKKAPKTKVLKKRAPKKLTKQEKHDDFMDIVEYLPAKLSRSSSFSSCSSLASLTSSPVKLTATYLNSSQAFVHKYEPLKEPFNVLRDSTNVKQQSEFQNSLTAVKNEFQNSKMKFLCDGPIILPKLSPNVETALNDKNLVKYALDFLVKETIQFYDENSYVIAPNDYRRIAQAFLGKYRALNEMTQLQVESDYIKMKCKIRAKPWTVVSKKLVEERRKQKVSK